MIHEQAESHSNNFLKSEPFQNFLPDHRSYVLVVWIYLHSCPPPPFFFKFQPSHWNLMNKEDNNSQMGQLLVLPSIP